MTPGTHRPRSALLRLLADDPATGRPAPWLRLALASSVALTLLVAAVLLLFTHPMGDDLCNAVNAQKFGVLGSLRREYLHWGGRWSSVPPAIGFPALLEISRWYPLALAAIAALQVFGVWLLLRNVLGLAGAPLRVFTLTLVALYWAGMPHPGQSVYFLEGAWVYSANVSLSMVVVAGLARLRPSGRRAFFGATGLVVLTLLVAASHELVGLVLGGTLGVGAGVALLDRDRRGFAWAACSLAAFVGVATIVLAPGNAVRGPTLNPEGPDLARGLRAAALMWVRVLDAPIARGHRMGSYTPLGWLDVRLLAATVLFLAAPSVRRMKPEWVSRRETLLRIAVPLTALAAITGTFVAGGWALGRTLPLRAFNFVYWVFLLGWFLTAFVHSRPREGSARLDPALRVLRDASIVALAVGLLVSTNFKHAVWDLTHGTLTGFDRAMKARYEDARRLRQAGERELVVDPIEPWPESYFGSDVGQISPELEQCVAAYFGVESVRLRK
jgi:hypothetical protein